MDNTTHLPQKIHQIAQNTPKKVCLNNQTEINRLRSNKNQSTEKRKNKKEARSGASAFCFIAVTSERRNDGAGHCANWRLKDVNGYFT